MVTDVGREPEDRGDDMADEAAGDGTAPMKTKKTPKLLILAVVGVVALAGAGTAGAWALGLFGGGEAEAASSGGDAHGEDGKTHGGTGSVGGKATAPAADPIFVDLPQLLVNLVSDGGGTRFLKLSLAVEVVDDKTAERIEKLSPRIVDSFQLYLRTLRPEELRGPGSMFRLKEDLHVRIHQAIEPAEVRDVLFKEMLVQ
jgi:flagellar FliL protein